MIVLALITKINGQYGEPFIGAVGQFTIDCKQTNIDVISSPNHRDYEILADYGFQYMCDFTVDTRECEHNPQSSGCDGIEIVWSVMRISENTSMTVRDGYNIYHNVFEIKNAGRIHNGRYTWKFNLKFEMKNVFQGFFDIKVVDLIKTHESCEYEDVCETNICRDNHCYDPNEKTSNFPWLLVGLVSGVVVLYC
ncbi:unnamed protein product [Medioppia subpectinata]|uniref:Uncharacterized protein n=1 Tax=Medioppia subpectinata TaxID=1979941 RepID=A0A7R9KVB8_9ACAR|nr:unnamed protein product [Medioppia subpectinata]CAG2110143.1 unnamed protein product [Medioppia subpectinata]